LEGEGSIGKPARKCNRDGRACLPREAAVQRTDPGESQKMPQNNQLVRVAIAQAAPVGFDQAATLAKLERLVREAAAEGSQLVVLPEAFVPGYPRGLAFGTVVGNRSSTGRELWKEYWEHAVPVPGAFTAALAALSRDLGVYLAVGVVEREEEQGRGTLYCTLLLFGPDGRLVNKHRKLKPTGTERLIWGEGDGSGLAVVQTPLGRIGGLICWENYMPLARAALYAGGVEIYLAPTADARPTWQATLSHIACEGRCFVLGCNQFVTKAELPASWANSAELQDMPEVLCRGGSAIYSPLGECLAGPAYDSEQLLFATLDLDDIARSKLDFDPVGHYARPDVFQLRVNRAPQKSVEFGRDDGKSS
jgi:nitrilase